MDLKSWLRRQSIDPSPMGRLISHAAWSTDPEEFFVRISKGTDQVFGREYHALAQGLLGQFKREKGKFKHPDRFRRVPVAPYIGGDVIAFRSKPAEQPINAGDVFWTRFYAVLLGLDIGEAAAEIAEHRPSRTAEITVFKPSRHLRDRRYG